MKTLVTLKKLLKVNYMVHFTESELANKVTNYSLAQLTIENCTLDEGILLLCKSRLKLNLASVALFSSFLVSFYTSTRHNFVVKKAIFILLRFEISCNSQVIGGFCQSQSTLSSSRGSNLGTQIP